MFGNALFKGFIALTVGLAASAFGDATTRIFERIDCAVAQQKICAAGSPELPLLKS